MVDRYYEPGEPKGRPYFFYYFVPQPWSSGGLAEIVDALTNPNTLDIHPAMDKFSQFWKEKLQGLKSRHESKNITQGRIESWGKIFKKYREEFGISLFNDGEECELWLDVQGSNEEEANDIVYNMFREISSSIGPDFNIEAEISPYDAENRKLLLLINPFTESYPVGGDHFDHCCKWRFGKYVKDEKLGDLVDSLFIKPRIK